MSEADEFTPTTEDVREHYAYGCGPEHTWNESRQAFDEWLHAHDDDVRRDCSE